MTSRRGATYPVTMTSLSLPLSASTSLGGDARRVLVAVAVAGACAEVVDRDAGATTRAVAPATQASRAGHKRRPDRQALLKAKYCPRIAQC